MRDAFANAGIKRYIPTRHAIDRASLRFGIPAREAAEWINAIMEDAICVARNGTRHIYETESGDMQIIVNSKTNAVITVHDKFRLDFLRPTLEREIRKIKRDGTRKIRAAERHLAGQYRKLSEQMTNYANARNPNTRELIGGRIEETESIIAGVKRSIKRMEDEVQAKIKAIEVIAE